MSRRSTFTLDNPGAVVEVTRAVGQRVAQEVLTDTVSLAPRDTGTLANSYTVVEREQGDVLLFVVGTSVEYAPAQEFGTSRNRATPHLGPALARARRKYGGRLL